VHRRCLPFAAGAGAGAAAYWVRGVHRPPGDHTDHRHGHQSGEEPWRRRPLQPAQSLERPCKRN
jgi:hypothetical protein